jgi:putative phosphoribosyl transferase
MLNDRTEAGERLASRLERYRDERPIVVALPRGGVPVAAPIARRLVAPLDVIVARKVGTPRNPEYGLGAVVEDGTVLLDEARVRAAGYRTEDLAATISRELEEAVERARRYRAGRPLPEVSGRTVALVDDGIATGVTVRAALRALRPRGPLRIVVAAGVAPLDTVRELEREADEVVVLESPAEFFAVGEFYRRFEPVGEDEVSRLLARGAADAGRPPDQQVR